MTNYHLDFLHQSPLFAPLGLLAHCFPQYWPQLQDYNAWVEPAHTNAQGQLIQFVAQDYDKKKPFAEQYEPRIFLTGQIQTRLQHWHDFFNACCWLLFPHTKARMNQLQYQDMRPTGPSKRSLRQHRLTQLDECGIVILCEDPYLLTLLQQHQWQTLFWQQRERLQQRCEFFILGHAIYEKALTPYLGLTAKAIILPMTFSSSTPLSQKIKDIDHALANNLSEENWYNSPLQPLPLLGIPDWYPNQCVSFYQNTQYFRPKH